MTSYLQRLDLLDRDIVTIQSDIGNVESNIETLQSNVISLETSISGLSTTQTVGNLTVTTNLILQSSNGNAYYLVVDDLGTLSTITVT